MNKINTVCILALAIFFETTVAFGVSGSCGAYMVCYADWLYNRDSDEDRDIEQVRAPATGRYNWEYEMRASAYVIVDGNDTGGVEAESKVVLDGGIASSNPVFAQASLDELGSESSTIGPVFGSGTDDLDATLSLKFDCTAYVNAWCAPGGTTTFWGQAACYGWGDISLAD